ncbi:stage II sporulation protein D [Virgibacillus massiliensis]|nr:stage II sporulation protein D [Virgibacillus massiliensis]
MKKIKSKQQSSLKKQHSTERLTRNDTLAIFKSKKPYYLNKKPKSPSKWRLPTVILLSSLLTIILVIPTLIVVPFGKDNQEQQSTGAIENEEAASSVELGSSPFSVSVMRTASDEVEGIPLEEYVVGVVASEMPADFEKEALKAQSLAARTYIVNHKLHGESTEKSDVTDTVQHQVYKDNYQLRKQWGSDYDWKINKIKEAVAETEGEILTYKESPITPAFFSTSNGYTENSEDYWENELPYLRSVESPWDENSPKFLDQKTFTFGQLEAALEIDLPNQTPLPIELTRTDSKRVGKLQIDGKTFSGRDVREKLELRSSDFTIEQKNDHFIFTTKGFGHGIGMSQYGANGMAKEGKNYKDIVNYYYKDVKISTVNETAPTLVSK